MTLNRNKIYWLLQTFGWLFFVLMNGLFSNLLNKENLFFLSLIFSAGISGTHFLRFVIRKFKWLELNFSWQIPLVIIGAIISGIVIYFLQFFIQKLVVSTLVFSLNVALVSVVSLSLVVFFWSVIYFLVHYIENYKKAEIENYKWQANINEMELNKLKSQLNPHFMFNAMNSIRALVEENPAKAKDSITQLSNILRNTLMMGKNKVISFDDEMKLVQDYVALESTRYEERLKVSFSIDPASSKFSVPPLMIQTLVENGIKHGISKVPEGGKLVLKTEVVNNALMVKIENTGRLNTETHSDTGLGLKNSQQRLTLLYGDKASLTINNINGNTVLTELLIPQFENA